MDSIAVTDQTRMFLIPLIFLVILTILVVVGRTRNQAGSSPGARIFEILLVTVTCLALGAFVTQSLQTDEVIINEFHRLYHDKGFEQTVLNTRWNGVELKKCPLDLWIYQEIIQETKPDVLIETGTWRGGGAYYFASIFDLFGKGRVLTVDIEKFPVPEHDRITYLIGSSTAPEIVEQFKNLIQEGETVMVSLDSNHEKEHVLNELRIYSELVSVGSYLVVEDTHLNGNPVRIVGDGDPKAAVEEFLRERDDFVADTSREKFLLTWNRGGWLKRVR